MWPLAKEIVDSYGALTEVRAAEMLDGRYAALALGFEQGGLMIRADGDYDTIQFRPLKRLYGEDLSARDPWPDAIGREPLWIWGLRNQQGYEDGCQIEFASSPRDNQPFLSIQFMVAASMLHVSRVGDQLPPS